ncbi:MAG: hypothetical protein K8F62_11945 [Pseudorhodoplanes sp.]|nr:hypothetical protein [Pseudorhodoplanes sp.]
MRKAKDIQKPGRAALSGGVIVLAALLAGCSSDGTTPASTGSSRSLSEIFSSKPASYAQAATSTKTDTTEFDPDNCPPVDIRQGASTFSVNTAAKNPADSQLRYQGSFAQTARSCSRSGPTMTIKLGVQGRIILGPGGGPGQVDVPIRFALVEEGVQPKTVWTKFYRVPVVIGEGQPSISFTHIEDDLTVPMPSKDTLEAYVLYVGFDPMGLSQKPKAPPPRSARPKVNG